MNGQLEQLFTEWRALDGQLGKIGAKNEIAVQEETCDHIIEAQSVLMRTAAIVSATSYREILFKLAFWRWDTPDLETSLHDLMRNDSMVYSAYRDLVELAGETRS